MHHSGTTILYNQKNKLHNKKFTNTIFITAHNYQEIKISIKYSISVKYKSA